MSQLSKESIKFMQLSELRQVARSLGVNPAGGKQALQERIGEVVDAGPSRQVNDFVPKYAESRVDRNASNQVGYLFGKASEPAPPSPYGGSQYSQGYDEPPPHHHYDEDIPSGYQYAPPPSHCYDEPPPQEDHGYSAPAPYQSQAPAPLRVEQAGLSQERAVTIKSMQLPELRSQLRSVGLSPAGSRDTLQTRLTEYMQGRGSDAPFSPPASTSGESSGFNFGAEPPARTHNNRANSAGGGASSLSYLFGGQ